MNGNALPPPPPLPVLTVMGNVVPLPLVNVIVFDDTDAVTIAFGVEDAVVAVPSNEPVKPDVIITLPVTVSEPESVISYASSPVKASID